MRAHHSAGFSLIEVMIAAGIAMTMFLALATIQTNMAQENRAVAQKMELQEFQRLLTQVMADDNLCRQNVSGLALVADAPSHDPVKQTYTAEFTDPLKTAFSPDRVIAQVGHPVPNLAYELPVRRIFVGDLMEIGTTSVSTTRIYSGAISVEVGDDPTATERKLVRPLRPARVMKKFFVTNGMIDSCGASDSETRQIPGAPVTMGLSDSVPATAECPAGMVAIGGGWTNEPLATLPADCPEHYAAVIINAPHIDQRHWNVLILCHRFTPYVSCYRPSFPKGP